jgi:hypothetical protein
MSVVGYFVMNSASICDIFEYPTDIICSISKAAPRNQG